MTKVRQMSLFGSKKARLNPGKNAKDVGLARACLANLENLLEARRYAKLFAEGHPEKTCTADDVQKVLQARGIDLGPAAGAIFREKCWQWTGRFVQSERISNHTRLLRVWRLI